MRFIPYQREILLALKILVPVAGMLFFDWSIGMLFLYFFLDLFFVAGETILKIFGSLQSGVMTRIGIFFRFIFVFAALFLFILIAAGHFFDGGATNMKAHIDRQLIYSLVLVYVVDFLVGFIFSGQYKSSTANAVEKNTYYLLGLIFFILLLFLILLNAFAQPNQVNYVLGISIVLAREVAAYWITRKNGKH